MTPNKPVARTYRFSKRIINSRLVPRTPGVYMIWNEHQKIYVGQTWSLKSRLFQHFNRVSDKAPCIWKYAPSRITIQRVDGADRSELLRVEREWIENYDPICN